MTIRALVSVEVSLKYVIEPTNVKVLPVFQNGFVEFQNKTAQEFDVKVASYAAPLVAVYITLVWS